MVNKYQYSESVLEVYETASIILLTTTFYALENTPGDILPEFSIPAAIIYLVFSLLYEQGAKRIGYQFKRVPFAILKVFFASLIGLLVGEHISQHFASNSFEFAAIATICVIVWIAALAFHLSINPISSKTLPVFGRVFTGAVMILATTIISPIWYEFQIVSGVSTPPSHPAALGTFLGAIVIALIIRWALHHFDRIPLIPSIGPANSEFIAITASTWVLLQGEVLASEIVIENVNNFTMFPQEQVLYLTLTPFIAGYILLIALYRIFVL